MTVDARGNNHKAAGRPDGGRFDRKAGQGSDDDLDLDEADARLAAAMPGMDADRRHMLIEAAMNQNFVPVVDDRGIFIGIVRRQAIIRYCYDKARTEARKAQSAPDACPKGSLAAGG